MRSKSGNVTCIASQQHDQHFISARCHTRDITYQPQSNRTTHAAVAVAVSLVEGGEDGLGRQVRQCRCAHLRGRDRIGEEGSGAVCVDECSVNTMVTHGLEALERDEALRAHVQRLEEPPDVLEHVRPPHARQHDRRELLLGYSDDGSVVTVVASSMWEAVIGMVLS
jgi:hypothetical protein